MSTQPMIHTLCIQIIVMVLFNFMQKKRTFREIYDHISSEKFTKMTFFSVVKKLLLIFNLNT